MAETLGSNGNPSGLKGRSGSDALKMLSEIKELTPEQLEERIAQYEREIASGSLGEADKLARERLVNSMRSLKKLSETEVPAVIENVAKPTANLVGSDKAFTPSGDAQIRLQIEHAANGLIEAGDGVIQAASKVATPEAKAALMADALKIANQYEVLPELIGLQSAISSGNQAQMQPAFEKLLKKCMQEGHPLQAPIQAMLPEMISAYEAQDPAVISRTLEKLLGEQGMPKGPVKDLLLQLKKPLENVAQHGANLVNAAKSQDPKKLQAIAEEIAAKNFPEIQQRIAKLEELGITLPAEAHAQISAFAKKHGHGVPTTATSPNITADAAAVAQEPIVVSPEPAIEAAEPKVVGTANGAVESASAASEPLAHVVETPNPAIKSGKPAIAEPAATIPEPVKPAVSGGYSTGYTPSYSSYSSSGASSVEAAVEEGFSTKMGKMFENHGGKLAIGAVVAAVIGAIVVRGRHSQREAERSSTPLNAGIVR